MLPWAAVNRLLPSWGASSDRTVPSVGSVCAICCVRVSHTLQRQTGHDGAALPARRRHSNTACTAEHMCSQKSSLCAEGGLAAQQLSLKCLDGCQLNHSLAEHQAARGPSHSLNVGFVHICAQNEVLLLGVDNCAPDRPRCRHAARLSISLAQAEQSDLLLMSCRVPLSS